LRTLPWGEADIQSLVVGCSIGQHPDASANGVGISYIAEEEIQFVSRSLLKSIANAVLAQSLHRS
jgi:hypothetical protein